MGACIRQVPVKSIDIEGGDRHIRLMSRPAIPRQGRSPPFAVPRHGPPLYFTCVITMAVVTAAPSWVTPWAVKPRLAVQIFGRREQQSPCPRSWGIGFQYLAVPSHQSHSIIKSQLRLRARLRPS